MTPQELKNSILQLAIQGKLVEQRPEEGTAEVVMECRPADELGRATDQVFRLLAEMNAPIRLMQEERDTLEEIFLRETE